MLLTSIVLSAKSLSASKKDFYMKIRELGMKGRNATVSCKFCPLSERDYSIREIYGNAGWFYFVELSFMWQYRFKTGTKVYDLFGIRISRGSYAFGWVILCSYKVANLLAATFRHQITRVTLKLSPAPAATTEQMRNMKMCALMTSTFWYATLHLLAVTFTPMISDLNLISIRLFPSKWDRQFF